jgi:minor extracellular protease Epr
MNVPSMWREAMGEGCRVVVLDTGLPKHLDLEPLGGKSFIEGYLHDMNGHSTHCAGIIGATAYNDMGVCGIAPNVEDYYGAVLDGEGNGAVDDIIRGIRWAVDELGAHIISMSLGMPDGMPHSRELEAACNYAVSRGCAVIAAAGNEGGKVGQPAIFDSVIAVAAVDNRLQHAAFSNMGEEVDFAAGGVNVYSTYLNNSYAKLSGTSMACPALAGIAALIISKHLKDGVILSPVELREHIQRIAYDVGKDGFDELHGHGIPIFGNAAPLEPDAVGTTPKPVEVKKPTFWSWLGELLKKLGLKKS